MTMTAATMTAAKFLEPADTGSSRYATIASPIGELLLTGDGRALTGLYMVKGHRRAPAIDPAWVRDQPGFGDTSAQLEQYFAGERTEFDLPLAPRGTEWQRLVWSALLEIPYGETASYRSLAEKVCTARAARAVGAANGANPICVIVPCHRVITSGGELGGYAGGLERKRSLLELEAR
jgi:methylated-DNA-[protein]-cysteine S-methyltransferase